jgi:D-xylulose reductase
MKLGNRVLIIGAGANAQLFVQLCRIQGASHITVMDTKPDRLDIALKLGADEIRCAEPNGPIENSSLGEDFDIVIVTRSKPGYFEAALSYCSWRGKILVYGVMKPGSKSALEPNLLWKKQLSIIGSRSYEAGNFQTALTLLSSGKVSVADLITRTISLDQVSVAFIDNQAHLKTVIVP